MAYSASAMLNSLASVVLAGEPSLLCAAVVEDHPTVDEGAVLVPALVAAAPAPELAAELDGELLPEAHLKVPSSSLSVMPSHIQWS